MSAQANTINRWKNGGCGIAFILCPGLMRYAKSQWKTHGICCKLSNTLCTMMLNKKRIVLITVGVATPISFEEGWFCTQQFGQRFLLFTQKFNLFWICIHKWAPAVVISSLAPWRWHIKYSGIIGGNSKLVFHHSSTLDMKSDPYIFNCQLQCGQRQL